MDIFDYQVDDVGNLVPSEAVLAWSEGTNAWDRHFGHHMICRREFEIKNGREPLATPLGQEFTDRGVCMIPDLVSKSSTQALRQAIDEYGVRLAETDSEADTTYFSLSWSHRRASLLRSVLPEVFNAEVSAAIEQYFGSYFQIFSVAMTRYTPVPQEHCSFAWHRDSDPPQQVHLMVYLSGASEEDGNTHFLDLETSRKAAEAGYAYPSIDDRTDDLEVVMGGPTPKDIVIRPHLSPGGAALFAATRTLHKGNWPFRQNRDSLLFLLMPSHEPWDRRIERDFRTLVLERADATATLINPLNDNAAVPASREFELPLWLQHCGMFPPDYRS